MPQALLGNVCKKTGVTSISYYCKTRSQLNLTALPSPEMATAVVTPAIGLATAAEPDQAPSVAHAMRQGDEWAMLVPAFLVSALHLA
jgi:hypothetical protein